MPSPPTETPTPALRRDVTAQESPYTAAFYHPWWGPDRHWSDGYVRTPTLEEYDCHEDAVIDNTPGHEPLNAIAR